MSAVSLHKRERKTISRSDVAKQAGVSVTTVSNVANGTGGVSEKVRARVERVIAELGYRPNLIARSLSTRRSGQVGILIDDIVNPYMSDLVRQICERLNRSGMRGMVMERAWADESLALTLAQGLMDGLCALDSTGPQSVAFVAMLVAKGIPVVVQGLETWDGIASEASGPGAGVPSATGVAGARASYEHGMEMIMRHLSDLGHRRVAFIGETQMATSMRYRGYLTMREELGLDCDDELAIQPVTQSVWTMEAGYKSALSLMQQCGQREQDALPTAIVAASDLVAIGVMRALLEKGVRVPTEVSVAGWDDIDQAAYVWPGLTTYRVDRARLADGMVESLLKLMDGGGPELKVFQGELIVRESTGRKG